MKTKVFFISGHLDLTEAEFEQHYVPLLEAANDAEDDYGPSRFVVGDARGADALAQKWLSEHLLSGDPVVTVFHMFESPRNHLHSFPLRGGFTSDKERDEAMTVASTHDIAWVRPGREKSGTAKNLARRTET